MDDQYTLKKSDECSDKRAGTAYATQRLTPVLSTVQVNDHKPRMKDVGVDQNTPK